MQTNEDKGYVHKYKEFKKELEEFTEIAQYEAILILAEELGLDPYKLSLIPHTLNYCENYIEEYDKHEIEHQILKNQYIPCYDDLNETTHEIITDLGYKEEDW